MLSLLGRKALLMGWKDLGSNWIADEKEVIRVINECDVVAARKILETNKDLMIRLLELCYTTNAVAVKAYQIFLNGLESAIKNLEDIAGNWALETYWSSHNGNVKSYYQSAYPTLNQGDKV